MHRRRASRTLNTRSPQTNGPMEYVAIIRPIETSESEAEGETLALALVEPEAKLPTGYQILAIRQG
jgi:hypothetical protein